MKDRNERSRGMEIRMADAFVKIKPTAVVKKVLQLARKPFLKMVEDGAKMVEMHKMAAETNSSGSEKEEAGSDSDSDKNEEDASLASWERVFNRFNKFWRRLL